MSRRHTSARLLLIAALAAGTSVGVLAGSASADVTRCVGATGTPGAFACYTSPRFDHAGLDRAAVATVPEVCYGLGCTSTQVLAFVPGTVGGRFIAVSYLGHSYTVYRPDAAQPYVLTSDNPRASALETVQVLALAATLTALDA